jgi:CheY-like chemotaxis protein
MGCQTSTPAVQIVQAGEEPTIAQVKSSHSKQNQAAHISSGGGGDTSDKTSGCGFVGPATPEDQQELEVSHSCQSGSNSPRPVVVEEQILPVDHIDNNNDGGVIEANIANNNPQEPEPEAQAEAQAEPAAAPVREAPPTPVMAAPQDPHPLGLPNDDINGGGGDAAAAMEDFPKYESPNGDGKELHGVPHSDPPNPQISEHPDAAHAPVRLPSSALVHVHQRLQRKFSHDFNSVEIVTPNRPNRLRVTTRIRTNILKQTEESAPSTPQSSVVIPRQKEPKHLTALLVDDSRVTQKITAAGLKKIGYKVTLAGDGMEAVELVKTNPVFTLILMDINMPQMDGTEATRIIRDYYTSQTESKVLHQKKTCILGLTGTVDAEALQRYQDAGLDGCIEKGSVIIKSVHAALDTMKHEQYTNEFVFIDNRNNVSTL